MDLDNSNNPEGELLEIANNILSIFNASNKIENEEDLFSDEFYIQIISILMNDEELQIEPGKTPEEKVENLRELLEVLSKMLEVDLSSIDVKAIILKHDRESTRDLLELCFSLIQNIIKANLEQMGEEDIELDDNQLDTHSLNENKLNLSETKESEKMRINKDEEINLENLESLRLGKDKDKDKSKNEKKETEEDKKEKEEEKKIEDSSNKKDEINDDEKDLDIKNSTNKKQKKNEDDDDEEYIPKSFNKQIDKEEGDEDDNISNLKEKEIADMNLFNDSNDLKANHISDSEKNSSKKKSNEIPNLLDAEENSAKKIKNQFEDIRISDQDNSDLDINYSQQHPPYSVPQTQQKLHLPSASEENDLENDNDFDYNLDKKSKKEDSMASNSNINNSSKNKTNKKDKDNDNSKSNHQTADKNNKNDTSSKKEIQSSNKKDKNEEEKSKKKENTEKINIEGSEGEGIQGGEPNDKNEKDADQNNVEQKVSQTNEDENGETPLIDEGFKYEIMKEFKRIYGDKLDNIFLKHNLQNSRNTFELALRNIKLAKQKMMKIENRIPEVDDLKTKEYLQKYEKQRQMMEVHYNREQKKLNFFEERAINNFKQNIKDMKKAKEIEAKKTENEIERRRKAQEVRNHHNQIRFCNEIYQRALRLEKEKNLEKIKKKREINRKENEEKRLAMERIENYYKDQIRLLKEILEKEKKQKEIEHRARIQFLSKFEREKRNEYRKELDNIFDRFEQEERKNEFERKNKKELNKIFDSYYGK